MRAAQTSENILEACSGNESEARGHSPEQNTVDSNTVFPDKEWETWATVNPESVGLSKTSVKKALDFAMERKSSSVVVVAKGKIVGERHAKVQSQGFMYRRFTHGFNSKGHQIEDVASVQKSVVSVLMGIAVSKKLLTLDDPVQKYLGVGWSNANKVQESKIEIRHLLQMTTGLNDGLNYVADPGTKWKYNTNAYQKTILVIAKAASMEPEEVVQKWLTEPLRMSHSKLAVRKTFGRRPKAFGFNTTAQDLARFGWLMLNNGQWNSKTIVEDKDYLKASTSPSQELNLRYGYLWWLNNRVKSNGQKIPTAPADMYMALGALGRKVYVVPSKKLVVVRLGDNPDRRGSQDFEEKFWKLLLAN